MVIFSSLGQDDDGILYASQATLGEDEFCVKYLGTTGMAYEG